MCSTPPTPSSLSLSLSSARRSHSISLPCVSPVSFAPTNSADESARDSVPGAIKRRQEQHAQYPLRGGGGQGLQDSRPHAPDQYFQGGQPVVVFAAALLLDPAFQHKPRRAFPCLPRLSRSASHPVALLSPTAISLCLYKVEQSVDSGVANGNTAVLHSKHVLVK